MVLARAAVHLAALDASPVALHAVPTAAHPAVQHAARPASPAAITWQVDAVTASLTRRHAVVAAVAPARVRRRGRYPRGQQHDLAAQD